MNSKLILGGIGIALLGFGSIILLTIKNRTIKIIGCACFGIGLGICYMTHVPFEWLNE